MKRFASFLLVLFLTACAQGGGFSDDKLRAPDYEKFGIIRLNVNEIQIVNAYIPPYHDPNVEHTLYLPPYVALHDWAQEHFRAVGNVGIAKVQILDASIVRRGLPVQNNFGSMFTDQISAEYKMHVKVRMEIISSNFDNQPYVEVEVSKTLQTPQSMTLAGRDTELHNMVTSMVVDVNKLMNKSIQDKLSNVIE